MILDDEDKKAVAVFGGKIDGDQIELTEEKKPVSMASLQLPLDSS